MPESAPNKNSLPKNNLNKQTQGKQDRGKLVVVSGPSGAGKSTVLCELLAKHPQTLRLSISATTRQPRPGEQDAIDYHYLSDEEFQTRRANGDFIECFEVFGQGHWYGTLHEEVVPNLAKGLWVILEIDVKGAQQVLQQYPQAITIFIHPGSEKELERRLRSRGTETKTAIERRLTVARKELQLTDTYEHVVVNDRVARAVAECSQILVMAGLG